MVQDIARAPSVKAVRDRAGSERRLVEAVGEVIARDGFDGLGARNVARQAGLDPKLIRMYFGNLDGLLDAYADSSQHWPTIDELTEGGAIAALPLDQRAARVLTNLAKAMQTRPLLHELLRAESTHQNELMLKLKARRDEVASEISRTYLGGLGTTRTGVDAWALLSVMAASIHYFAIRVAHPEKGFNGLGIERPEEMARLVKVIEAVCATCLGPDMLPAAAVGEDRPSKPRRGDDGSHG
jgi:AcrR family transcriptional regulator